MIVKRALFNTLSLLGVGTVALSFLIFSAFPQLTDAAVAMNSVVITLNVQTGISITAPGNSNMSTVIGIAQNSAVGTTTWSVITNNVLGYTLAVNATSAPAMQQASSTSIADYQTGSPNTWSVAANAAAFGYSGFGTDVPTVVWGSGTSCSAATSTPNSSLNYKGFTTSPFTVAQRASTTTQAGVPTTICYAAAQGTSYFIPSGTYYATIVATATTL